MATGKNLTTTNFLPAVTGLLKTINAYNIICVLAI